MHRDNRLNQSSTRRYILSISLLLTVVFSGEAQAPAPPEAPHSEVEDLAAATKQQVDVSVVPDGKIRERLQRILETTSRFEDLNVRVENGVVFLTGKTGRDEYREWARDLALRTEDVVAVVNNLEVVLEVAPLWDISPAVAELESLVRATIRQLPLIGMAFLLLLLTFAAASLVQWISRPILRSRIENPLIRGTVRGCIIFIVMILGFYIVLRVSGLTRLALTMIGGTGIIGLIIGFAFRDIAENFLASLLISVQKPFRIGDTIEVAGYAGLVEKVTTRGTVLMAYDGNYIQLTNATVYKSTIRNITRNPKLRLDFTVGVGYDADVAEVQALLLGVVQRHPAVYDEPEPRVFVEKLAPSTIELHVYFWMNVVEYSQFKVRSAVIRQSVAELIKAGVSMPDDNREVTFPQSVPVIIVRDEDQMAVPPNQKKAGEKKQVQLVESPAATEAEGDLASEVHELKAQAALSDSPEEGRDILSPEEKGDPADDQHD